MTDRGRETLGDAAGPAWEKRGGANWVECPACRTWFPVGREMLVSGAPPCCCPACHTGFQPAPPPR